MPKSLTAALYYKLGLQDPSTDSLHQLNRMVETGIITPEQAREALTYDPNYFTDAQGAVWVDPETFQVEVPAPGKYPVGVDWGYVDQLGDKLGSGQLDVIDEAYRHCLKQGVEPFKGDIREQLTRLQNQISNLALKCGSEESRLDRLTDHVNREIGVAEEIPLHARVTLAEKFIPDGSGCIRCLKTFDNCKCGVLRDVQKKSQKRKKK
jgi:hypothetical protein